MVDRKLIRNIVIFTILLTLIGTIGFRLTGHLTYGEAMYETIIILLTHVDHHGFEDTASRAIVLLLTVSSLIVVAYLLKFLADYIVGWGDGLKRHQMKARVAKLNDHYIVCGLGRVGSQVAAELSDEGTTFVGLDKNEDKVKAAIQDGYTALVGDSTNEEFLESAGVKRAKGIVVSLGDDSGNLFITLAARQMNPHIFIVSRVNREENRTRLERAGADRTAMPYQLGGYHMATMLTRPNAVDFLEILATNDNSHLHVQEMKIVDHSSLAGKTLNWLYRQKVGATVLALNSSDALSKVNPSGEETIYAGDQLVVMGTTDQLKQISELV